MGAPVPGPTPRPVNAGLAASLLRAFLAKATWKAGEAGWGDDAEGWGREFDEVPWPQVTASSELRPDRPPYILSWWEGKLSRP